MYPVKNSEQLIYDFVASKVREFRKEQNLSQEEFSRYVDLSRVSIANIETGNQKPTLDLVWKISSIFAVKIDYFFPSEIDLLKSSGKNQTIDFINELMEGS
ncbi:MAG: hypothetical protein C0433_10350 [Cyclobacterium sp.]|nr:hypothetical protein [Cyclobacterium sp.]